MSNVRENKKKPQGHMEKSKYKNLEDDATFVTKSAENSSGHLFSFPNTQRETKTKNKNQK